jgi:hypothetical protein
LLISFTARTCADVRTPKARRIAAAQSREPEDVEHDALTRANRPTPLTGVDIGIVPSRKTVRLWAARLRTLSGV